MKHKRKDAYSSNSEDALTWSCFDMLASLPSLDKVTVLDELLEDSFEGDSPLSFKNHNKDIDIYVGKSYEGKSINESTEIDASIEAPRILIFIEAKLYSSLEPANPPEKPHDQIARKLRVGLDYTNNTDKEFFFLFLDIAPVKKIYKRQKKEIAIKWKGNGYHDKWLSAWFFKHYKGRRNSSLRPLEKALHGINNHPPVDQVARNMGLWVG